VWKEPAELIGRNLEGVHPQTYAGRLVQAGKKGIIFLAQETSHFNEKGYRQLQRDITRPIYHDLSFRAFYNR